MSENEFRDFDENEIAFEGTGKVASQIPAVTDSVIAARLKSLNRQRNLAMHKVLRIYENVQLPIDSANFKVYESKLQSAYDEYSKYHNEITAIVPEDAVSAQEDEYIRFEDYYQHTSVAVESRLMRQPINQVAPPAQVIVHQQPLKAYLKF